jgi:hypothetical protein
MVPLGAIFDREFPLLVPKSKAVGKGGALAATVYFAYIGFTHTISWRRIRRRI